MFSGFTGFNLVNPENILFILSNLLPTATKRLVELHY